MIKLKLINKDNTLEAIIIDKSYEIRIAQPVDYLEIMCLSKEKFGSQVSIDNVKIGNRYIGKSNIRGVMRLYEKITISNIREKYLSFDDLRKGVEFT